MVGYTLFGHWRGLEGRRFFVAENWCTNLIHGEGYSYALALTCKGSVMRKKPDLPTKTCATCGRPFAWRKKWAKVWDEVRYCSQRCRRAR